MSWESLHTCLPAGSSKANPALELIRHSWPHLAGARLSGSTSPRALDRRGMLTLQAAGPGTDDALRAQRLELLKRLQSFAGTEVVRDIRWEFQASPLPAPTPSPPPPLPVNLQGLGEKISDPDLKRAFTNACRRVLGRRSPSQK